MEHGLQKCALLESMFLFHSCFFTHNEKLTWLTTISCHYLRALRAIDAGIQQPHAPKHLLPQLEVNTWRLFAMIRVQYAIKTYSRTFRSQVSQPASANNGADLVNCKLITAWYQNNRTVVPALVQCECHIGKQNCRCKCWLHFVSADFTFSKTADFTFSRKLYIIVSDESRIIFLPERPTVSVNILYRLEISAIA